MVKNGSLRAINTGTAALDELAISETAISRQDWFKWRNQGDFTH
jgi:hypothetical protein